MIPIIRIFPTFMHHLKNLTMKKILIVALCLFSTLAFAQEKLTYQKPSKEILDLVDVQPTPSVQLDDNNEYMILMYRDAFMSIAELSRTEMRLAGLRIDPKTNIGSRTRYSKNIRIKNIKEKDSEMIQVKGLPKNPLISNFSWSPDQKKAAFTHTAENGVELWMLDIETASAKQLTKPVLNANMRGVITWMEDSKSLLVKMISEKRQALIDINNAIPSGPTVSDNDGSEAPNATYQDLLKNPNDEHNFEQLALSDIFKISLDGTSDKWLDGAMYTSISLSPDGNYVMVNKLEKPFSYIVSYNRFPTNTSIYTKDAKKVKTILESPLLEELPTGRSSTRAGMRSLGWRSDKASMLFYAVALDEGDAKKKVDFRDEVFVLDAPFNGSPKSIMKTINRYSGITWGNDEIAIAQDSWWDTRNSKTYVFNPSDASQKPEIIFDLNSQDRYSDPGRFVTRKNEMGNRVLALDENNAFLTGSGYSEKGQFPFIDMLNLETMEKERIYQSEYTDKLESLRKYDVKKSLLLVSIESKNEYPNYYFRNLKRNKLVQITFFENPFKSIQDVHKEVIKYKRDDGLELSGTLYLPVGYDMNKKEKMPMILWAYPREYKDKASASQVTSNPNKFTSPNYGSPIHWVAKGYVVLDGAAFPIVGEGDTEPNDLFRSQLVANAKAAIDAVDKLGYIDRSKVAVGGHSYGAFMVANLLSHCDLFAAGIARSGAYNRTLTPFGFQSEQRSYWEAPDVYYTMSPFMHADKMKTPLLLIHGEADNNSGTYPLQSIRYFNALKGLGATVRLVVLPKESHGYSAKESVLHMLWEQDQWLEKHVKNN